MPFLKPVFNVSCRRQGRKTTWFRMGRHDLWWKMLQVDKMEAYHDDHNDLFPAMHLYMYSIWLTCDFMVEQKLVYFSCAFGSRASNLPDVSHEVRMMTTIQSTGTVLVSQSFVCKGWVFCHTTEDQSMETKCAAALITSNPPGKMKNCRFCSTSTRRKYPVYQTRPLKTFNRLLNSPINELLRSGLPITDM